MKPKTRFMKMYYKLPYESRVQLVYKPYGRTPMTLCVCSFEVRRDTGLGKKILKGLGYVDD